MTQVLRQTNPDSKDPEEAIFTFLATRGRFAQSLRVLLGWTERGGVGGRRALAKT